MLIKWTARGCTLNGVEYLKKDAPSIALMMKTQLLKGSKK